MRQLRGIDLKRFNKEVQKRFKDKKELVLVLFSVDYQANLAIIFRLCDGLGVKKLYLTGGVSAPTGNVFERISRHKAKFVDWELEPDITKVLNNLKNDGHELVAVEITEESVEYSKFTWKDKTALILGNEGHGVPDKILKLCDASVYVPMLGEGGSLNVGMAASIVGYSTLK